MNLTLFHPSLDTLKRFADAELGESRRIRVAAHLADCGRCRERVAELRALREALRALPLPEPTHDLLARIEASRAAGPRVILPVAIQASRVNRRPYVAAAAIVLVTAGGLLFSTIRDRDGSESQFSSTGFGGMPFFPSDAFAQEPGGRLYKAKYQPAALELGRFGPGQWVYRTRVVIDGYATDSVEADTLTIASDEYRGRGVWRITNRWGWKYFAARDTLLVSRQDLRPVRRAHPAPAVQRPGTTPPGIDFPPDTGLGPLLLARVSSHYPGTSLSGKMYPALGLLNFVYAKPALLLLPLASDWRGSIFLSFGWGKHQFGRIPLDMRVVGRETVHVPAGTFDCWKVELTVPSSRIKTTIWVSRDRRWLVRLHEPFHDGAQEQVLVSATPPGP